MARWNNSPKDPRCQRVVTNNPNKRSTLGVSEGLLGDYLTILSLSLLDKKIGKGV